MHVIDVIPLSRTAPGVLSYRSRTDLPVGSIVDIILRKTATQGVVVASTPVEEAKEMLKHARFLLSKSAPSASGILPEAVLKAAHETASYHASSVGSVLAALFGEYIRSGANLPTASFQDSNAFSSGTCEKPVTNRAEEYEAIIQEVISKGAAALLVVPTIAECLYWKERFSSYKPLVLSGALTAARRVKALEAATAHTGLIIATPSFSWTPIVPLAAIIVDRISAGTYTLPKRPYIDVVRSLETLARARGIPLVCGDYPLPLEYRKGDAAPSASGTAPRVIDARRDPDDQLAAEKPWRIFPENVVASMVQERADGGRIVVLAARSGYAPAVVCRDCGQALVDERGLPLTFTTAGGKRMYRTSDGKSTVDAKIKCPRCESWNLFPLGVGQERVVEELRKEFPDAEVIEANAEALRSPASAKKLLARFAEPGSIMVGGEGLLPWLLLASAGDGLDAKLPLGVIASADSLLSLPFWRARERFVRLAYLFNTLCREMVLVTRHPEDTAVDAVANPSSSLFWKEERSLRKILQYPPYGTLITLTMEGSSQAVARMREHIEELLAMYAPSALADQATAASGVRAVLVLSLPEGKWPDPELSAALQSLPPGVRIRIDPESLW